MLLDSYAWIEYLTGSDKGKKVKDALFENKCFTSIVSISEITEWCLKNNKDVGERIFLIKSQSDILNIDENVTLLAGKINFLRKKMVNGWSMLDSLILATSFKYGLHILTGDKHFSDLENVVML